MFGIVYNKGDKTILLQLRVMVDGELLEMDWRGSCRDIIGWVEYLFTMIEDNVTQSCVVH